MNNQTSTTQQNNRILNEETCSQFKNMLQGTLLQPGDAQYDEARSIYNGMINKKPAYIARCLNVDDVILSVNFARDNNLLLAILGGGHNGPGLGLCDGGLVIDLSLMNEIKVDAEAKTAKVEPGCRWGEVDQTTHEYGLATVSGVIANTGVAGLTLGGGHGYLTRKYGLTIDNLLEVEIVLANGNLVTANNSEHKDLFWAVRGGGGNFGVVVSFKFNLNPVKMVTGGPIIWPFDQAREVMQWYREFIKNAPDDVYGFLALMKVPPVPVFPENLHNKKSCTIIWCYTGSEEKADEVFQPILNVGTPLLNGVQRMPYPALQSAFDPLLPPGLQWYWKGDFVKELPDEAIDLHIQHAEKVPNLLSTMHLYPINGAVHQVGENETAWGFRDATWSMVIAGIGDNPAENDNMIAWAKDYWEALHPFSAGGAYPNFMMEEGEQRVKAAYGNNYKRLVELKRKYDPNNLFRVNQNIKP